MVVFRIESIIESMIILRDGAGVPVVDIGVVSPCLPSRHTLLLTDVVYVTSKERNLISVFALDNMATLLNL